MIKAWLLCHEIKKKQILCAKDLQKAKIDIRNVLEQLW